MKPEPQKAEYFSESQHTLNSLPAFISPSNTQSFNRYSYCWNNPLVYTDPSVEFIYTTTAAQIEYQNYRLGVNTEYARQIFQNQ